MMHVYLYYFYDVFVICTSIDLYLREKKLNIYLFFNVKLDAHYSSNDTKQRYLWRLDLCYLLFIIVLFMVIRRVGSMFLNSLVYRC